MSATDKIERGIFVISNWTICGLLGLGLLLEGGARANILVGLVGVVVIVAGFIAHLIANFVFQQDFTKGEIALGLGIYAAGTIIYILLSVLVGLAQSATILGILALGTIALGFIAYLLTRFGARGAFRKFDAASRALSGHQHK